MPPTVRPRPVRTYIVLAALTIFLGLASRRYPHAFSPVFAKYAGDALWAALVYWLLAFFLSGVRVRNIAAAAIAISFAVEISQLFRVPALDALRHTTLGALMFGRGFLWSDFPCYLVGVAVAAFIDTLIRRWAGR